MELKIKDRDYVSDGAGALVSASGREELLERVLYKLSVRRGSFALAPELGSELHLLWREKGETRDGGEAVCGGGTGGGSGGDGERRFFGAEGRPSAAARRAAL